MPFHGITSSMLGNFGITRQYVGPCPGFMAKPKPLVERIRNLCSQVEIPNLLKR